MRDWNLTVHDVGNLAEFMDGRSLDELALVARRRVIGLVAQVVLADHWIGYNWGADNDRGAVSAARIAGPYETGVSAVAFVLACYATRIRFGFDWADGENLDLFLRGAERNGFIARGRADALRFRAIALNAARRFGAKNPFQRASSPRVRT